MKNIGIRVDGNSNIGMGHVMRCLVICKKLRDENVEVIFIVKEDKKVIEILKENKFAYEIIESTTLEKELKIFDNIIKQKGLEAILIDSYWINNEYLEKIYSSVNMLISIDDNNLYDYPSHIILNANIYAKDINYKSINPKTKLLLGCDYAILRDEFILSSPINVKDKVENILVTMGGCDINSYTPIVLKSIVNLNATINVIVGPNFKCIKEIDDLGFKYKNIKIFKNPKDIRDIMINNDIAISASGTTTYELGVLGVPTILIPQADNQENVASKSEQLGMMINLGYFEQVKKEDINKAVLDLINNKSKRQTMNKQCIKNIGKNGVENIVKEIINYKHVEEDKE